MVDFNDAIEMVVSNANNTLIVISCFCFFGWFLVLNTRPMCYELLTHTIHFESVRNNLFFFSVNIFQYTQPIESYVNSVKSFSLQHTSNAGLRRLFHNIVVFFVARSLSLSPWYSHVCDRFLLSHRHIVVHTIDGYEHFWSVYEYEKWLFFQTLSISFSRTVHLTNWQLIKYISELCFLNVFSVSLSLSLFVPCPMLLIFWGLARTIPS